MGDLKIAKYIYTPEDMMGTNGMDIKADLETKLLAALGNNPSKVYGWHCLEVRGMFVFVLLYEDE